MALIQNNINQMGKLYYENTTPSDLISKEISNSEKCPLVLVFTADWVSSSTIVDIVSQKIVDDREDISLITIDADNNKELFSKYRIRKVPSCIIIKNQEIVNRIEGTFSKKEVLDSIDKD